MFDVQILLEQFLGNKPGGGTGGLSPDLLKGLAGGAAAGGLASIFLGPRSAKKLASSALKIGGTAALAGLAFKADLAMLAARLKLDPGLKATVEREASKALA